MVKKPLPELKTIFIDTGVFIDLLRSDFSGASEDTLQRVSLTRKFFSAIDGYSKDAIIQTSSINIAELFHFDENDETVLQAIVPVINGKQFEIISFDESSALFHNKEFGHMVGNAVINELKKAVNYEKGNGFANISDRIRKDMLIASAAKQYSADIVLTNDSGFLELCNRLNISCFCFTHDEADFITSIDGDKIYNWA